MTSDIVVRSYMPSDFEQIKRIHEQNGIDYRLPSLSSFPVNKVLEVEGTVRAAMGLQHTVEGHLWLDKSAWTDAEGKWMAVKAVERETSEAAAGLGIKSILCCIPPGYERFARRVKELGYLPLRDGWKVLCKSTGDGQ